MEQQLQFIKEKIRQAHPSKQWEWDCKAGMTHDDAYTLADVLLAMKESPELSKINREKLIIQQKSHILRPSWCHWNLLKDSLSDQSHETISFIANLLK